MDELRQAFDEGAALYDAQRKLIIPDLEGFYNAAVWAAEWPGRCPYVLDIGAGTGLLSARILERYPEATLTLLDFSKEMLDVARQRLHGRPNIFFRIADYSQESLSGRYDIIVSALSIHHLAHQKKRRLYSEIFDALNGNGIFVNAEQVRGETPWTDRRNIEYWDTFVRSGGLSKTEWEQVRQRRDYFDQMERLSVQMRWMRNIGFSDVDMIYKNRSFAVFSGRKILD
jgi:tRNA (cmo5U34)-methyltransferase